MIYVIISGGFLLGLAGSFHCMGMCGPIALAISGNSQTETRNKATVYFLYFFGKTLSYSILGLLFGLFGQGLVLAGWQQWLSISMGILLIAMVFLSYYTPAFYHQNAFSSYYYSLFRPFFGKLLKSKNQLSVLLLGMLNGLLPCGLVYVGLAAATATGDFLLSPLFMISFGIGTIPLMLAFLFFTQKMNASLRGKLKQFAPVFMGVVGAILILRGLNIGIPFISPLSDALQISSVTAGKVISCTP